MKKVLINQQGVTVLAAVLIAAIVGIIGFSGYRIYQINKGVSETQSESSKISRDKKDKEEPDAKQLPTYMNDNPKFSFQYPEGWKVTKKSSENSYVSIEIESPNFKDEEGALCRTLVSGFKFNVSYNSQFADPNIINTVMTDDPSWAFENQKKTTLGGKEAVEYDASPGECGYAHTTKTFQNGYEFGVNGYHGAPSLGEYSDEYQTITNSLEF